jgi:hypothetical protein
MAKYTVVAVLLCCAAVTVQGRLFQTGECLGWRRTVAPSGLQPVTEPSLTAEVYHVC